MIARFRPGKAAGEVNAPPSKSMAHRLLLAAALSDQESRVGNLALSEDILATQDCLRALGKVLETEETETGLCARILPGDLSASDEISHRNLSPTPKGTRLLVRESGSTLRFLIPVALTLGAPVTFTGAKRLFERPLSVYEKLAEEEGFLFEKTVDSVTVSGKLQPKSYEIAGNISSQFISGLLFALPGLPGDSRIVLQPPIESRPYIDMTIQALGLFGIRVFWEDERCIFVPGNQKAQGRQVVTEGDYSNAAFLEVLNLFGGDVRVKGLDPRSLQGDRVYREYFEKLKRGPACLDLSDCPDLGPVLFAAAAALGHGAEFRGIRRLRIKESDRIACMQEELRKFGVRSTAEENRLILEAGKLQIPKEALSGHNDHRIVMALSSLLTLTGGEIHGIEAVRKSYPDYFEQIRKLGIEVEIHAVDQ